MRIAINIDGQFALMSGIQRYVDNLLGALYASGTTHDISAFAPSLTSAAALEKTVRDEAFAWRNHPRARTEILRRGMQFSAFSLNRLQFSRRHFFQRGPRRSDIAERVDRRIMTPLWQRAAGLWQPIAKRCGLTPESRETRRIQAASRKYHLLHTPSPATLYFEICQAKHNIVTIYDLTTRTCPWAHTSHNIAIWERLFAYAQKRCSRVITISEASKRDIIEHLGIAEDRVDVTPLAAKAATYRVTDENVLRESLDSLGLADTPFVLYTGTLEPRKNLERLIEAFNQMVKETRFLPHKLVLAGGTVDHYDQKVLRLARELGIGDRVVATGYVTNKAMNALMSACDVFVYVSQYEGFGLPPLEAMTCGAPVITSDVTSLPEVVGEAGVQVSPLNTEQIAAAIHLLLTNAAENARHRALSLERAKCFTWERTAALTLQSYEAAVR